MFFFIWKYKWIFTQQKPVKSSFFVIFSGKADAVDIKVAG